MSIRRTLFFLPIVLASMLPGCLLSLEHAPCPCVAAMICCEATSTCMADRADCPARDLSGSEEVPSEPAPTPVAAACIVRAEGTSSPLASAPDLGTGYAKQPVHGITNLTGLRAACTSAIYQTLLERHCAAQRTPVQTLVATYDASGTPTLSACGSLGCNFMTCP